jgi:hypothetical protein
MRHSEIQDQIPLYAVGGLSTEESSRLAEHLRICPSCRALLNEYQFVAEEMLEQVPPLTAPSQIGIRLQNLAQADAVKTRSRSNGSSPIPTPKADKPRFWNQRLALPRWALALGLLFFLLLLGASGALAWQVQQQSVVGEQVLSLLSDHGLKFVELTASTPNGTVGGFLCINEDNETALLWLYGMEPIGYDQVYQVWIRDGENRYDGGTFRPNYDGRAVAVVHAPRPFGDLTEIGVTLEPASGSEWPTTPKVVGGKLD